MPMTIKGPSSPVVIEVRPLRQQDFCAFGTVIENPDPALTPSEQLQPLPPDAVQANQGSALKYANITEMLNLYESGPDKAVSKAVMSMFVCAPRELRRSQDERQTGLFPVEILERHPFTTQTFIPLGLSSDEQDKGRYLVVVAPSSRPSDLDQPLPVPTSSPSGGKLPGRGLPDLSRMRAFVANGSQAVTYGAGTWHAPMVALGKTPVAFVVIQFANGVGIEDCQEVMFPPKDGEGIQVAVPVVSRHGGTKL
ncbi:MAG: Ureidoglycolate lyase [Claussenomyces sp. TS43310]|nr:MAG: Ureidoglycolate lyase [Claussenomyces sp. TS43310]